MTVFCKHKEGTILVLANYPDVPLVVVYRPQGHVSCKHNSLFDALNVSVLRVPYSR